jgi:hypothetical protein
MDTEAKSARRFSLQHREEEIQDRPVFNSSQTMRMNAEPPPNGVAYHGAAQCHAMVRQAIAATPLGAMVLMSAGAMVEQLMAWGLPAPMAKRLFSQIRQGAPLHDEWKRAFDDGRFVQRLGRTARSATGGRGATGRGKAQAPKGDEAKTKYRGAKKSPDDPDKSGQSPGFAQATGQRSRKISDDEAEATAVLLLLCGRVRDHSPPSGPAFLEAEKADNEVLPPPSKKQRRPNEEGGKNTRGDKAGASPVAATQAPGDRRAPKLGDCDRSLSEVSVSSDVDVTAVSVEQQPRLPLGNKPPSSLPPFVQVAFDHTPVSTVSTGGAPAAFSMIPDFRRGPIQHAGGYFPTPGFSPSTVGWRFSNLGPPSFMGSFSPWQHSYYAACAPREFLP